MVLIPTLDYRAASGGWPVPLQLVLNVCSDTLQDYDCPWLKIASSRDGLDWKKMVAGRGEGAGRKRGEETGEGFYNKKINEINLKKKKQNLSVMKMSYALSPLRQRTAMIIINY